MSPAATLATVLLAYLPAAVTPGPNFVLIAHTAAAGTRRAAVAVALGVVVAGGLLAAVAVFGLGSLLARTPWLATALRVVCGAYLAWLGVRLWLRARAPDTAPPSGHGSAFRQGVVSNLTNPKAAAFFGSVLTATLPPAEPTAVKAAAVALIVTASAAWHLSVALLFSASSTQRWYARAKPALNRVVGTILVVLGLVLAWTP
ncbi:Threonine/homoserine/homoserine lactone efflux protein [Amycolatopsis tolypomycina]|uniref:Threonine/homoserine/homoserine lactone efflux protein n=1 Tax=Amycolatopsis tolypomycina TaxID=208445 RepID=A0A1H4X3R7_9PSEU|nr:LysE family transporter [Amycolatopsis tolypomycina]SED00306.1 Threonine/homoserine/homoserine lactone efflux protein [Amycolatopsis tolypomycina]